MRTVSQNFTDKVKSSVKHYDIGCLISWSKEIREDAAFGKYDEANYDEDALYASENDDVISFSDRYVYKNETPWLQNFKITQKLSNRPWGVIQGTAEITLNNTSGRFFKNYDPDIGPFVDLPNRPVQLQIGVDGEYIRMFTGYASRPRSTIVSRDTTLQCFDAVSYLANQTSNLTAFIGATADQIMHDLIIEAGFGEDQFQLDPSLQRPISFAAVKGRKVIDILQELCDAECYVIFADGNGIIHGYNYNHMVATGNNDWTINYDNAVDMALESTDILNDVIVKAKPYKTMTSGLLWRLEQASDDTMVQGNSSMNLWADLVDANNAPVYATENPDITFTANSAQDGSGTDLTPNISVIAYNFGSTIKLTFSNSGSSTAYITFVELNGKSAQQVGLKSMEARDPDSIERYGINPNSSSTGEIYEVENEFIQDSPAINFIASILVGNYSDPYGKLQIDNFIVPQLEIGDEIQVTIGSTGESFQALVFGNEITVGVDASFKQQIYVEERPIYQFARYDEATYDDGFVYG